MTAGALMTRASEQCPGSTPQHQLCREVKAHPGLLCGRSRYQAKHTPEALAIETLDPGAVDA